MKKLLALVLAMVMTLGLATVGASAKTTYADADKIDYNEAVDVMTEIGVLGGDENGFRPTDELKRSEGAKIITYLMLGGAAAEQLTGGNKFSDVPASHWAAGYIEYLAVEGVVGGVGNGKFDPDGTLTTAQFAKMLLGALGYDATIEGFGGADWMINVQAAAKKANLFDGNSSAVATSSIKRQEAALYAFNMIQQPLVEYENKGSTMNVNGATISFGASKATYVVNTGKDWQKYTHINNTTYNPTGGVAAGQQQIVEFAEEYYNDLYKADETDDFGRKATKWTYKGKEIGKYAVKDQWIYTTKVTLGQIYKDLGLSNDTYLTTNDHLSSHLINTSNTSDSTRYASLYFIDGVPCDKDGKRTAQSNASIVAAGGTAIGNGTNVPLVIEKESTRSIGGNGTETYVYYDDGEVRICEVNWYSGEVVGVYGATAEKEAYFDIVGRGAEAVEGSIAVANGDNIALNTSGNKTGTGFAIDDVVIYNVAWSASKQYTDSPSISNVKKAEVIEGEMNSYVKLGRETINNYSATGSITVAGKKYDYSAKVSSTPDGTFLREGIKIKITLDKYGNVISVGDYSIQNYAVVIEAGVGGDFNRTNLVNLLLTDGTTTGAVKLVSGNSSLDGTGGLYYNSSTTSIKKGDIVTYTKAADGEYRITPVKPMKNLFTITQAYVDDEIAFVTNGNYKLNSDAFGSGNDGRANGKTVFLIIDSTGKYKVFNGIKEVPTIIMKAKGTMEVNSYAGAGKTSADIVFLNLEDGLATMKSNDTIFVKFPASVGKSVLSSGDSYYELPAWVNGEETTIKLNSADGDKPGWADGSKTHYKMFTTMTVNKNGIATLGDQIKPVFGSKKMDGNSVGLGAAGSYTLANPCKVFEIKDNKLLVSSANAIPTSDTTMIWFNTDSSNSANYIFWTRESTAYNATTYAAWLTSHVGGTEAQYLAYLMTDAVTSEGETIYYIPNNTTSTTVGRVPINSNVEIPAGKRLVVNGAVTVKGATLTVSGDLETTQLTLGNGGATKDSYVTAKSGANVVIENNLDVKSDGHYDNQAGANLVTYNKNGDENSIAGKSLRSYGTVEMSGDVKILGVLEVFGGNFQIGAKLTVDDKSGNAKITIGEKNNTLKIVFNVNGDFTAENVSSSKSILVIEDIGTTGTVSLGTVTLVDNAKIEINGTTANVSMGKVSGGTIDNDSKNLTLISATGTKTEGDEADRIPTNSSRKVRVNMTNAMLSADGKKVTGVSVGLYNQDGTLASTLTSGVYVNEEDTTPTLTVLDVQIVAENASDLLGLDTLGSYVIIPSDNYGAYKLNKDSIAKGEVSFRLEYVGTLSKPAANSTATAK